VHIWRIGILSQGLSAIMQNYSLLDGCNIRPTCGNALFLVLRILNSDTTPSRIKP
jgi:hypothetical protein